MITIQLKLLKLRFVFMNLNRPAKYQLTPWRNGSASDSRSEGCVFKSRRGQLFFILIHISYWSHGMRGWVIFQLFTLVSQVRTLAVSKQKIIINCNQQYVVDPEKLSTETKQINAWFTSLRGVCVKKSFFHYFGSSLFFWWLMRATLTCMLKKRSIL